MKPLILIGVCCFGGAYWFGVSASELSRQTYPWVFDESLTPPLATHDWLQKEYAAEEEMRRLDGNAGLCFIGGVICVGLGLVLGPMRKAFGKSQAKSVSLDAPLLAWSESDVMTVRDLLNGGILVLGRTGSGKTSSSGLSIAEGIVNA